MEIAVAASRSDAPHRAQAALPGMFSNWQLGHCIWQLPLATMNLDATLDLVVRLVVFAGQLPRFFAANDLSEKLCHIETAGALDPFRADGDLPFGVDLDFDFFVHDNSLSLRSS